MARRYVRDSAGRFASTGGGGKRKGKLSKSTAGRGAKAKYKKAAGKAREWQDMATNPDFTTPSSRKKYASAKGQLTRTTNKMTGRRKAAGSGLKKGLSAQAASRRKQTFSSKATKGRTAKAAYKKASRADRKEGFGASKARKKVIKKQTGKTAYAQKGSSDLGRSKALRSRTKSQKIRAKIDRKKFANKELRGSEFKGKKKRVTKKAAAAAKRAQLQKREAEFRKKLKERRKGGLKPKPGETAKQFRGRLKRGAKSPHVHRALRRSGGISEYYGTRTKKKETAKSRRRAETRDTWGDGTGGNRRSTAITKSKERHAYKMRKRRERERRRNRRR